MNNTIIPLVAIDEPRWIGVLRQQCIVSTQSAVAEKIGYSAAVVNQILKGTYKGSLVAVEKAVRGCFMGETVICPVLGEIESNLCNEHQRRPFASTNTVRVQLYRACHTPCPNNITNKKR